jgi:hypothetical protein
MFNFLKKKHRTTKEEFMFTVEQDAYCTLANDLRLLARDVNLSHKKTRHQQLKGWAEDQTEVHTLIKNLKSSAEAGKFQFVYWNKSTEYLSTLQEYLEKVLGFVVVGEYSIDNIPRIIIKWSTGVRG